MGTIVLVILIAGLAIRWFVLRERLQRVQGEIAELKQRMFRLENAGTSVPVTERKVVEEVTAAPAFTEPPRTPTPVRDVYEPKVEPAPRELFAHTSYPASPRSSYSEFFRQCFGNDEWEALVGGSLLNKIGALVLVIGIALFLGYSFTHMTPAGRAVTALGASAALLCGGVWLERKQLYRVFARGLIGAGWASFYVTAYAMYAVPAARLIDNAFFGSLLLLLVAAGMIAHSLRYRVEAITAVAYFAAFAALSVTPSSSFALVSLVPLSVSLLFLARRFNWSTMALFGVIATYAACAWRATSEPGLFATQSLLLLYWLLFEAFDLLRVRSRRTGPAVEFIFALNAIAFLALSYQAWAIHAPGSMWLGGAFGSVLFLASAIVRVRIRSPRSFPADADLISRIRAGSYEAPVIISAALAGLSIAARITGVWLAAGLAIEAEVLYLAGVLLDLALLRRLGGVGFAFSLARLLINDVGSEQTILVNATRVHAWAPPALFQAALFYVNRLLRRPNAAYSTLAAALIASVLAAELPERFIGTGWLVFAAVLFEIGVRRLRSEFRFQAYVLAANGVVINVWFHVLRTWAHPWIPLSCALVLVYALVLRLHFARELSVKEQKAFDFAAGAAITGLASMLVWNLAPAHYKGLFLCGLTPVLFEFGARRVPSSLTRFSYVCAAIASATVIAESGAQYAKFGPAHVWLSYACAAVSLYILAERAGRTEPIVVITASSAGVLFALSTLWLLLPDAVVTAAWAAFSVALFASGLYRKRVHERWQGYLVIMAAVLHTIATGFHASAVILICACYLAQFISPAQGEHTPRGWLGYIERHPRVFWSVVGTFSLSALLQQQFPGGLLTIAWGIEGLALLVAGFPLRARVLRLEGLSMLVVCVLKLFFYDLRNLETIYRILSFVALGVILLAVSSLYTRFRERVKRYL